MKELIGRKFTYNLVPDQVKTVVTVNNETVVFDDGGRVPLNRFNEMFTSVDSPNSIVNAEIVDPKDFLDPSSRSNFYQKLKQDIEKIDVNKVAAQPVTAPKISAEDQMLLGNVQEPPVKRINVDIAEDGKVTSTVENTGSSLDILKKMKRTNQVQLNVSWVENIPSLDFIKIMDENLDNSILEYLVDDIVEKMTTSPGILANQVRTQLKQMIETGKLKKPTQSKVRKKALKKKGNERQNQSAESN